MRPVLSALSGYIWTEQGVLTSIDADNQGSAVFFYFQSGFVCSGHGYRARNFSALGTKSA